MDGLIAGRRVVVLHAGMPFMPVPGIRELSVHLQGNCYRRTWHRRSVLAKRHGHRAVAL